MGEILHISIGKGGSSLGLGYWNKVVDEHGLGGGQFSQDISNDMVNKLNVSFEETEKGKYVPRAIFADSEPSIVDQVKSSDIGRLVKEKNILFRGSGLGNQWAKGFHSEGIQIVDDIEERVRNNVENADSLQGFQISHSLGGGSGSGMGSLLSERLRDAYPDKEIMTFSIMPSPRVSDVVVEPYNAVLTLEYLLKNVDGVQVLDNEGVYNMVSTQHKMKHPSYSDINDIMIKGLLGITAPFRFETSKIGNMTEYLDHMVPYQPLQFLMTGLSSMNSINDINSSHALIQQIRNKNTYLGNVSSLEEDNMNSLISATTSYNGIGSLADFQIGVIDCPMVYKPMQSLTRDIHLTYTTNHTNVKELLQRQIVRFNKMFKRKAFLHWYKGEGMEETDFTSARFSCNRAITAYNDYTL